VLNDASQIENLKTEPETISRSNLRGTVIRKWSRTAISPFDRARCSMAAASPRRKSAQSLLLLVLLMAVVGCSPHRETDSRFDEVARSPEAARLEGSSAFEASQRKERILLEQAAAARDPRYFPRVVDSSPVLVHSAMRARFSANGAQIAFGKGRETNVALRAVVRGGQRKEMAAAYPFVHGAEVRSERGAGVTEWWRSLPSGLEHGVTLESRPTALVGSCSRSAWMRPALSPAAVTR
jgi:hypothetical protein